MASPTQVKQYLAYWFQLGKRLVIDNGREVLLPQPVIQGDRYSAEFEACWQHVLQHNGRDCYLEGTSQTLDELLSSTWEITPCVRCQMPVPILSLGSQSSSSCPCFDLPGWPNMVLPQPRMPIDSQTQLNQIRNRLQNGHAAAQFHSESNGHSASHNSSDDRHSESEQLRQLLRRGIEHPADQQQ